MPVTVLEVGARRRQQVTQDGPPLPGPSEATRSLPDDQGASIGTRRHPCHPGAGWERITPTSAAKQLP